MELPIKCVSGVNEQQCVIHFLAAEKCSVKNIHDRLKNVYGDDAVSLQTVKSCVEEFKTSHDHDSVLHEKGMDELATQ